MTLWHEEEQKVHLTLPASVNERITRLAAETCRTRNRYIQLIVLRYLEHLDHLDNPEKDELADWDWGFLAKEYLRINSARPDKLSPATPKVNE